MGYVLSSDVLTHVLNLVSSASSIRSLYNRKQSTLKFADLLCGSTSSLGGRLQSYGYDRTGKTSNRGHRKNPEKSYNCEPHDFTNQNCGKYEYSNHKITVRYFIFN